MRVKVETESFMDYCAKVSHAGGNAAMQGTALTSLLNSYEKRIDDDCRESRRQIKLLDRQIEEVKQESKEASQEDKQQKELYNQQLLKMLSDLKDDLEQHILLLKRKKSEIAPLIYRLKNEMDELATAFRYGENYLEQYQNAINGLGNGA